MSTIKVFLLQNLRPKGGLGTAQISHSEDELMRNYNARVMIEKILELRGGTDLISAVSND